MSKRRNRIILLALVCALALILGACGHKANGVNSDPAAPDQSEQTDPAVSADPAQNTDPVGDPVGAEEAGKTVEEMLSEKNALAPELTDGEITYARKKNVSSYLFLGIDADKVPEQGSVDGLGQSDVLLLLVVDNDAKKYTTVQINRDTMVEIDILDFTGAPVRGLTAVQQICLAHSYGNGREASCENVVRAVSRLLGGIEIDGYASLRYAAIPALNDAVGGVAVTIEDDFSQADETLVQGETVELTGKHALTFIRNRLDVGDGTNISRQKRHRAYLDAFSARLKEELRGNSAKINELYGIARPYMVTDMSLGTFSDIAAKSLTYTSGGTVTLSGEVQRVAYVDGLSHMEFTADLDSLSRTVLELYYVRTE